MGAVTVGSAAVDINKRSVINYHVKKSHRPGEIIVKPPLDTRKSQQCVLEILQYA